MATVLERTLLQIERAVLGDRDVVPALMTRLRAHQINRLMLISPLLGYVGMVNAGVLLVMANADQFAPLVSLWLLIIIGAHMMLPHKARAYARRGARSEVSIGTLRRLTLSTGWLSIMWGSIPLVGSTTMTPHEMTIVYAFLAGTVGGGCAVLALVPTAMVSWVVGMSVFAFAGALTLEPTQGAALGMGIVTFCFVMLAACRAYAGSFALSVLSELEVRQQAAMVETLLREFEDSGRDWLWETDAQNRLVRGLDDLATMTGVTPRALYALMNGGSVKGMGIASTDGFATMRRKVQACEAFRAHEIKIRFEDGHAVWFVVSGKPVHDESGRFIGYRGVVSDTTEARQQEENFKWLAHHDALTGLYNRAAMNAHLAELFARKGGTGPLAAFYIDLDDFKGINDSRGHAAGDLVLQKFAQRMRDAMPDASHISRLGGDEFVAIITDLPGDKAAAVRELAARLTTSFRQPVCLGDAELSVRASMGIAIAPEHGATADALINAADIALYEAKAHEAGTWRLYDPDMDKARRKERQLEEDLRKAIAANGLTLHFQPFFAIETGAICGFEALARWTHPEFGPVSPSVFIPLAERSNLIVELGDWVVTEACRVAVLWPDDLNVAVNLSVQQFQNGRASRAVADALQTSGLAPSRLEVEITERVFASDIDSVRAEMRALHDLGVWISLDDFGTGYSSLHYVMNFPFDKLKIDKAFVERAGRDPKAHGVLTIMSDLATRLNLVSTVEGIETQAQLDMVRELGFTYSQGFLQGRPVPDSEIAALLLASHIDCKANDDPDSGVKLTGT